jgi:hypothetical protein
LTTSAVRRRARMSASSAAFDRWGTGPVTTISVLPAAPALLRDHAYATDRTVDDLAADPVGRHVHPDQLREDGGDDG